MNALEQLQKQLKEDFIRAQLGNCDGVQIDARGCISFSFKFGHFASYSRPRGTFLIERVEYINPEDSQVETTKTTRYLKVAISLNELRAMVREIDKTWRASSPF